jgi:hypothetical protein
MKYRVVFKRSFVEYGTIVVEAEDEDEARDAARDLLDEAEWTQQELDEEIHESTEKIDTEEKHEAKYRSNRQTLSRAVAVHQSKERKRKAT